MRRVVRRAPLLALLLPVLLIGPEASAAPDGGAGATDGSTSPDAIVQRIHELLAAPRAKERVLPSAAFPEAQDATLRRVEAFRLWQALPEKRREMLRPLFAGPTPGTCLRSELYPLRSCYDRADQRDLALTVLVAAEAAWASEVEELGFLPPRQESDEGPRAGMDFFVGDTRSIGAAGYTSPVDFDPTTPHTDCLSYIVIDELAEAGDPPGQPDEYTSTLVYHEFNHACQLAMDCLESLSSMEATATWVEPVVLGHADSGFATVIRYFQRFPGYSLGLFLSDSYYPYGAALFVQFLHERLGQGDPRSIAELWHGTIQVADVNEPDFLDAVGLKAEEQGSGLAELLLEFGEWRYFLGSNDDGHHFREGAAWRGAEIRPAETLSLPVLRLPGSRSATMQPYGYHYAYLETSRGWLPGGKVVLSLGGSAAERSFMELWLVRDGQLAQRLTTAGLPDGEQPRLVVDAAALDEADRAVLLLANVKADVDWDSNWRDQTTYYDIAALAQPAVVAVEPAELVIGAQAEVAISGAGFSDLTVLQIDHPGLTVGEVRVVDATRLQAVVAAGTDAAPGAVDVRVASMLDDLRLDAVLPGGLTLVMPAQPRLAELYPPQGAPGEQVIVRLGGESLPRDLAASFSCPEITVERVSWVSEQTAYLHLALAPGVVAETVCDLHVEDRFGRKALLAGAFRIVPRAGGDAGGESERGERDSGDGGCTMGGGSPRTAGLLAVLLLLLLLGVACRDAEQRCWRPLAPSRGGRRGGTCGDRP